MMDLRTMMPPRLLLLVLLQNATEEDKKSALTAQFSLLSLLQSLGKARSSSSRRKTNEKVLPENFNFLYTKMKHFMTKKKEKKSLFPCCCWGEREPDCNSPAAIIICLVQK